MIENASHLHLLHRANQFAGELFMKIAAERNVKTTYRQAIILKAIQAQPHLSQKDLVEATNVDRSTVCELVTRLAAKGLLVRKRSKEDARAYDVTLTAAGDRMATEAAQILDLVEAQMLCRIPTVNRRALAPMLSLMVP